MSDMDHKGLNERRQLAYTLLRERRYGEALQRFLEVFDGTEPEIANCIAYIYSLSDYDGKNEGKSLEYYQVSASRGDDYAQYAIGGIYFVRGDIASAVRYYELASKNGNAECSYQLYKILRDSGNRNGADEILKRAADQGHPLCITKRSIRAINGKYGAHSIIPGIISYFRNIPALIKYSKERVN